MQIAGLKASNVSPSSLISLASPLAPECGADRCGSIASTLWTDLDGSLLGQPGQVCTHARVILHDNDTSLHTCHMKMPTCQLVCESPQLYWNKAI